MHRSSIALAAVACALAAAPAGADVIVYQFNGSLTNNTMASGAFAGASVGVPVSLRFTIDSTTTPAFTNANRNHWDTVAGTVLGMRATVNGYTSIVTPNSAPAHARVADDALNSSVYIDQFWIEASAAGAAPDFTIGIVALSSSGAAPPISSSLSGTDWPTTSAELDASSFTLEHYIILRGATGPEFLRADITSITVVPAPAAPTVAALIAIPALSRRRRC